MNVGGLENNYYLSGNEIWISVQASDSRIFNLIKLNVKNLSTNRTLNQFTLYPSINNDFYFNIGAPVRALLPNPTHVNNSLNSYEITIEAFYTDEENPTETKVLNKFFLRGGVDRWQRDDWFLANFEPLVIEKWIMFSNVENPLFPQRIENNVVREFTPSNFETINLTEGCNAIGVKWLNSLGGWQYWVFEANQTTVKTKVGDKSRRISTRLSGDNFQNLNIEKTKTLDVFSRTPNHLQPIIEDLISAIEVYQYHPLSKDIWQRMKVVNNESLENTWQRVFENEISFELQTNAIRSL